jgi:DNA-binding MarR family transcriptional regulator
MTPKIDTIWMGLARASHAVPGNLSLKSLALALLVSRFVGPMSLKAIRTQLGLDYVQTSRAIAGAERAGLVRRIPMPGDGRETLAIPTDQGRALVALLTKDTAA